jgi:hypothetical protein
MMHPKLLEKQEVKSKIHRWKAIINIWTELNEIEMKLYKKSMNQKIGSLKRKIRLVNP